jgi:hypothetical protein
MGQVQSGVISVDDFGDRVMGAVVAILSPRVDSSLTFQPLEKISPQDKHVLPMLQSNQGNQYTTYYSEDKRESINNYITNHILDSEEHLNHFTNALIGSLTGQDNLKTKVNAPNAPNASNASNASNAPNSNIQAVVQHQHQHQHQHQPQPQQRAPVEPPRPVATHAPSIKSASTARPPPSIAKASRRTEATQVTRASSATQVTRATRATEATGASSATQVFAELEVENETPSIRPVKGSNKLQKRIHTIDQAIDMERIAHQRMREAQENIKASYRESDVQSVYPSIQSNVKAVIQPVTDEDNADEDHEEFDFENVQSEPKDQDTPEPEAITDNEES